MRQTPAAPIAAAGGAATGLAAVVIGLFVIADCVRFQSKPGQCNKEVQENALMIVLGLTSLAGTAGAFFTVNPLLDRILPDKRNDEATPAQAAVAQLIPSAAVAALSSPSILRRITPAAQPKDQPQGADKAKGRKEKALDAERVEFMHARGLSDEQISEATGLSPRRVARILAEAADLEPGL